MYICMIFAYVLEFITSSFQFNLKYFLLGGLKGSGLANN